MHASGIEMRIERNRLAHIGIGWFLMVGLSGCASNRVTELVFQQGAPVFHHNTAQTDEVDYESSNSFQAPLLVNGKIVGELVGARQVVEKSADLELWADALHIDGYNPQAKDQILVFTSMIFNLGGEDSLMVQGQTIVVPADHAQMPIDKPEVRSIIGGTGKYRYARGQLISTRNKDGSYTQVLDFKN